MEGKAAIECLRDVRLLAPLSDCELGALAGAVNWQKIKRRQVLVSHLEDGADVYFVISGRFKVHLVSPIGRQVHIRELHPGSHFGEIAALTGAPRSVGVVAMSAGLVAVCPQAAFLEAMTTNAAFARLVASELARTVVELTDKVFELSALELRFRLYAELLRLARRGEIVDGGVRIAEAPSNATLAAATGAKRETINRELRKLADEGVLHQDRREILIKDLARIEDLVLRRGGQMASALGEPR